MSFENYLEEIIENIDDENVKGIAKKAIDIGFDKLGKKQQFVLNQGISNYIMKECPNCGEHISYEDMAIAIDNGRCSSCEYDWNKNYIVDDENHKIAVQLDIKTYEQITETLENFALYKLMEESEDNETLSIKDAKEYYKSLKENKAS